MAAYVEMADGAPAHYTGGKWKSPDPGLAETLEYFTRKLPDRDRPYSPEDITRGVAAMLVGVRVFEEESLP